MALSDEEYANGRTVRSPNGDDYVVTDFITGGTGHQYLLVADDDGFYVVPTSTIRDEWEARSPEDVQQDKDNPVTDEPDVTDSQEEE